VGEVGGSQEISVRSRRTAEKRGNDDKKNWKFQNYASI
jgi:hypothetical protein